MLAFCSYACIQICPITPRRLSLKMTFKGLTHTQIASPNPCIQCPVPSFEQHLVLTYCLCMLGPSRVKTTCRGSKTHFT